MKRLLIVCAALFAMTPAVKGQQSYRPTGWGMGSWQAIGATGTPDESSGARILLQNNGWAEIRPEISKASVKLRYNIPPVDGLKGFPDEEYSGYELRVHARDNGAAARVIVTVKAMHWGDGGIRTLVQLDSDSFEPGTDIFWGGGFLRDETGVMKYFRPFHNAYWAEVQLIKTAREGRPGIQALGILVEDP